MLASSANFPGKYFIATIKEIRNWQNWRLSFFLIFSDFAYYLNIEEQQLIPAVRRLIQKSKNPEIKNSPDQPEIKELIWEIRLAHNAAVEKLIHFKTLKKNA